MFLKSESHMDFPRRNEFSHMPKPLFVTSIVVSLVLACNICFSQEITVKNLPIGVPIFLGQSAVFSGATQSLGLEARKGIEVHLSEINKLGGLNNRPILLKSLDDQGEPLLAVENAKQLIQTEEVIGLIGTVGTSTSEAVSSLAMSRRVPLIAPFSGADSLRISTNKFIFNIRASHRREAERLAKQLEAMGIKTVSIVYQNDTFGKISLERFQSVAESLGMQVLTKKILSSDRENIQISAKEVAVAAAQSVVIFATYDLASNFIRSSRSAGNSSMFMTVSVVGSKALTEQLLEEARGMGMTQVMPYPWSASVPLVANYQRAMRQSGYSEKDFNYSSLEGYVAARVAVEGLKHAGKDPSSESLFISLERLGSIDLGGYVVSFGTNDREGSKYVDLIVVGSGGKFLK